MPYQSQQRRRAVRPLLAACLASLTLVAAACGGSSSSSSSPASGSSSSASAGAPGGGGGSDAISAAKADLAKYTGPVSSYPTIKSISGGVSKLKGKNIWYIPIGSAVPILNGFGVGIQGAVTKLGAQFHACDGKFLPTTIAACINQAASQGADGVVTGYIDYALVPTAFDNLVSKHIPVLIAGEAPSGGKTDSPQLAFDDTSPSINLLQRLNNEAVIVDSNGKAKILFIGVTDSPQTLGAAAYSKQFYKDNCPGCTFTEIDYNTASLNRVPSQVSSALISHPDTTYVISELDASAASALSGIQTAGYTNKVKLSGTNGGLDSLQRIKAGQVQFADAGTSPIYLGWQFADGIARMLVGQLPVNGLGLARIFTKDNVGGLTLTPEAYNSNAWYGSDDFQKTFTTAWGI